MKILLLASVLMLSCNSSFAQEDEEEVAPQESAPRVHSSAGPSESLDPEKAKDMMDKLRAGQKTREDQNKFMEELDIED